jgi:sterol carrier protein 2
MSGKVFVTGVGMIPFAKPGASAPYHEMGARGGGGGVGGGGVPY